MNRFPPIDPCYSARWDSRPLEDMPLAMAYVPWQQFKNTYDLEKALSVGTIFPELDLRFFGKRGICP